MAKTPTSPHAIDTVVFDLGGVLIDWNPRHLYRKLFAGDEAAMEAFLAARHLLLCSAILGNTLGPGAVVTDQQGGGDPRDGSRVLRAARQTSLPAALDIAHRIKFGIDAISRASG